MSPSLVRTSTENKARNQASGFSYQGQELDIFVWARNWKQYWSSQVAPWVKGDVLEVGAGFGANTPLMQNPRVRSWHCLEPDAGLAHRLAEGVRSIPRCTTQTGTLADIGDKKFDSILYIDVLEHIEFDGEEMQRAVRALKPGGHVVILSPAHQFLFSPFDAAIGHYRRYNKTSLKACSPEGAVLKSMFYLDAFGMLLSAANRVMLKQSNPTVDQIRTWDTYVIPVSKIFDRLTGFVVGKTIIGVWQRAGE